MLPAKKIDSAKELERFVGSECILIESFVVCIVSVLSVNEDQQGISMFVKEVSDKKVKYQPVPQNNVPGDKEQIKGDPGRKFKLSINFDSGAVFQIGEDYLQFSGFYWGGTTRLYFVQEFVDAFKKGSMDWFDEKIRQSGNKNTAS